MEQLTTKLEETMQDFLGKWNVAGMSVALIKDGKVITSKGYGLRDVKENLPMTADTVLPIGSISKSFTAVALGMLADEGKLDFDKPVREYIPWLKLYDPITTQLVTTRDLLCHRVGVPRYDLQVAVGALDDRKKQVETFQYLQPNKGFRTTLQYSNQMVTLAGYLVDVLSGQPCEEFVKTRIFDKLGMDHTDYEVDSLPKYEEYSKGYIYAGEYIEPAYLHLGALNPAGGIVSSASDMAKYALFQLGDGTWNGERLISKEMLDMMHSEQMIGSPYFWQFEEAPSTNYGLCWFTDIYRGKKMVSHGGNTNGYSAQLTLIPEDGFALVALSNATSSFSVNALSNIMADEELGVEDMPDWNSRYQQIFDNMMAEAIKGMQARAGGKIEGTKPSHPLEEYTGIFTHPGFGIFEISAKEDGSLAGKWNGFDAIFTHYHYDCYDVMLPVMGASIPARFEAGDDGHIASLYVTIEAAEGIDPVKFTK